MNYAVVIVDPDYYKVEAICDKDTMVSAPKENRMYHPVDSSTLDTIQDALNSGKDIIIPRKLTRPAVLSDLLIDVDPVEAKKSVILSRMSKDFDSYNNVIALLSVFGFMKANNVFRSVGIEITDANREEKYLEVLNSGDTDLINNLEAYLNAMDEVSKVSWKYERFAEFKSAVEAASEAELDALVSQYRA